jgi:hydrogenase nickel incorporation protein HypA/HybF
MHELAVTQSLLELALNKAQENHAQRVTELHLVIGRLASIVDDSVQFYFDALSAGTLCEHAQLHFRRLPASLSCQDCGTAYTLDRDLEPCPQCGGAQVRVTGGDEFYLESIEIEARESVAA